MEQMRLPKSYKTPKQMAEELDVSEKTIYRMCQSGQLPSYRIGGRWRIYEEAELLVEDSDMVLQQFKQGMKKAGW
jgi:excisionase family DNA binding protein